MRFELYAQGKDEPGAFVADATEIDVRTTPDALAHTHIGRRWYETGTGHRQIGDHPHQPAGSLWIARDVVRPVCFIEITSLEGLVALADRHNCALVRRSNGNYTRWMLELDHECE